MDEVDSDNETHDMAGKVADVTQAFTNDLVGGGDIVNDISTFDPHQVYPFKCETCRKFCVYSHGNHTLCEKDGWLHLWEVFWCDSSKFLWYDI